MPLDEDPLAKLSASAATQTPPRSHRSSKVMPDPKGSTLPMSGDRARRAGDGNNMGWVTKTPEATKGVEYSGTGDRVKDW